MTHGKKPEEKSEDRHEAHMKKHRPSGTAMPKHHEPDADDRGGRGDGDADDHDEDDGTY